MGASDSRDGSSSLLQDLTTSSAYTLQEHLKLLEPNVENGKVIEVANAPLFSNIVRAHAQVEATLSPECEAPFPQYGLLAGDINGKKSKDQDSRIFCNIAAPSSIFICGKQGSGKSHTLSCLLENCLLPSQANVLSNPLTGIVFHYDTFTSDTSGSPCEAAYLSSREEVSVRVLCAPSNVGQITRIYSRLPNVTVEELRINESDLNTKRMLDLMAVSSIHGSLPLYLHIVIRILRQLRTSQQETGSTFSYSRFKELIDRETLKQEQLLPLQQRLEQLESFMNEKQAMMSYEASSADSFSDSTTSLFNMAKEGNSWVPKVSIILQSSNGANIALRPAN